MPNITVYITDYCPYCTRAKQLLDKKGQKYTVIDVTHDTAGREALVMRSGGRRTVPQIFIGDTHVGGCDDLYALDKAGKLDPLLAA